MSLPVVENLLVNLRSSAKNNTRVQNIDVGKSFIYIKNKSGPIIEPCTTPEVNGILLYTDEFTLTDWMRQDR